MKTINSFPQCEILRWIGHMGHKFAVIYPSSEPGAKMYNGWRCSLETDSLNSAEKEQTEHPGAEIWEQVGRRRWRQIK